MRSHFVYVTLLYCSPTRIADLAGAGEASRGGQLRIASWFVWCQACRHGGHAGHIFNWFHGTSNGGLPPALIECPVNGCTCRCAGLDSTVPPPRPQPTSRIRLLSGDTDIVQSSPDQSTILSDNDTEPLPSDGELELLEIGGMKTERSPVAPASVPKNRREIVDPVIRFLDAD